MKYFLRSLNSSAERVAAIDLPQPLSPTAHRAPNGIDLQLATQTLPQPQAEPKQS